MSFSKYSSFVLDEPTSSRRNSAPVTTKQQLKSRLRKLSLIVGNDNHRDRFYPYDDNAPEEFSTEEDRLAREIYVRKERRRSSMITSTVKQYAQPVNRSKYNQQELAYSIKNGVAYLQRKIDSTEYFRHVMARLKKDLVKLYVGDNQLTSIPDEIQLFTKLELLSAESNRLNVISSSIEIVLLLHPILYL